MNPVSFRIRVELENKKLIGLSALDWRRVRGLPDNDHLDICGMTESREVEVGEGFARAYGELFRNATLIYAAVDADLCVPGDLQETPANSAYVNWSDQISDKRLIELWEAGV
jgi:hypothetical protein